jgi:hypothetical protein
MSRPMSGVVSAVCITVCLVSLSAWFYTWAHGNVSRGHWYFAIALFAGLIVLLSRKEPEKDD